MEFHVYAIASLQTGRIYIGHTGDVYQRFLAHNRGMVGSTRFNRPWKLVKTEHFETRAAARWQERRLKRSRGMRLKWLYC